MKTSNAAHDDGPVIDSVLNDYLNMLPGLNDAFFAAHWDYQETQSATQRKAAHAAFAQAVYELDGVTAYLHTYLAQMRDGVTVKQPGRVIPWRAKRAGARAQETPQRPRCWNQPRDARGRFVKRTD